jgi:hypothetical protein
VVVEGTGVLLPVDFEPDDLSRMIQLYANMPKNELNKIRAKAFKNWNSNFNASVNYKDFIMKVNSILALSNKTTQQFNYEDRTGGFKVS